MTLKVLLADDEEAVLALVQATLDGDGRYQKGQKVGKTLEYGFRHRKIYIRVGLNLT